MFTAYPCGIQYEIVLGKCAVSEYFILKNGIIANDCVQVSWRHDIQR